MVPGQYKKPGEGNLRGFRTILNGEWRTHPESVPPSTAGTIDDVSRQGGEERVKTMTTIFIAVVTPTAVPS